MIIDSTLVFSSNQAITASGASTNMIDLGGTGTPFGSPVALPADIAIGNSIDMMMNCTQAFNNLTSLQVSLQVSSDGATWKEASSRTYLAAELATPTQLNFPAKLPVGVNLRYLHLYYTVNGSAPTTGQIFAAVVAARQSNNH